MALKLTKDEAERQAGYITSMREKRDALSAAVTVFNTALEAARVDLRKAVSDYNEVLTEVNGFAADVASRLDDEISGKSEKWQEGDKGEAAMAWKDEWEQIDFSEIDADEIAPSDIEFEDDDNPETLEAISSAPEDF